MISQIPNALTRGECAALIASMESGFETCGSSYPPSYRTNDRQVLDDAGLAAVLLKRLHAHLPRRHRGGRLVGINSRLRGCRYRPGQAFSRHLDGVHHRSETVRSALTFMIYLNDAVEFSGGDTRFFASRTAAEVTHRVTPAGGTLIIFDHDLWHEGAVVTAGVKYILRSDLLYEYPAPDQPSDDHRGYIWAVQPLADGTLATGGRDTTIRIWRNGTLCQVLPGHDLSVTALAEDERGRLWSGSRDGTVRIWEHRGAWQLVGERLAHDGAVLSLLSGPGGVLSAGADGVIRCGEAVLHRGLGWLWQLAWSAEGHLLSAGDDGLVRSDGVPMLDLKAPAWSLAVLPDGSLAAGDARGRIHYRDRVISAHTGGIRALLALADGRLISGSEDGTVRHKGTVLAQHNDFVTALAPVRGGVLSASYDGSLRRISLATRSPERTAPSIKPIHTSAVSVPAQ